VRDFDVGWICAIMTEYVVAEELLDEEYDQGPGDVDIHDDNVYTYGRVGSHNVVIACLPKGRYGTSSAASVARDMHRSFPNIRFGMMVGIGGGAPSATHDIRLGDVVVSTPVRRAGGVIHYDHGKAIQDRKFEPTGSLNQPPSVLLNAIQKVSTRHLRKGHKIAQTIDEMTRKSPRLAKTYSKPAPETDVLFKASFTHPYDWQPCSASCLTHTTQVVQRPARDELEDDPQIHYGLIASADRLMKDAMTRDHLAETEGVLCFEMEAAGLMDRFPCVVIRGISDYSDTHKNDQWQGYAAASAAAYAKELLCVIPATTGRHKPLPDYEHPAGDENADGRPTLVRSKTADAGVGHSSIDLLPTNAQAGVYRTPDTQPEIPIPGQVEQQADHAHMSGTARPQQSRKSPEHTGLVQSSQARGPILMTEPGYPEDAIIDRKSPAQQTTATCAATHETSRRPHNTQSQKETGFPPNEHVPMREKHCVTKPIRGTVMEEDLGNWLTSLFTARLPCPGPFCDSRVPLKWTCYNCGKTLQRARAGRHLYCHCGRTPYYNYTYNCNAQEHGEGFECFDIRTFLEVLGEFDPGLELTLLVIGEPGVGKSTFINALLNYLRFDTLDDAMESPQLHWAVPGSFTMQNITRDAGDAKIVHTTVRIGLERRDSHVEDATLCPGMISYVVHVGRAKIRLINCNAIGKVAVWETHPNSELFATLASLSTLNGILFLVKANSTQLNSPFDSFLGELLSWLPATAIQVSLPFLEAPLLPSNTSAKQARTWYLVSPTPGPSVSRQAILSTF
jgi:nucleoside phosphorylase